MNTLHKILLTTPLLLAGATAQAETEQRDLSDFDAIDVSGGVDIDLVQGATFSVVVEADDGNVKDIVTRVRNGTLHIEVDRDWGDRRSWDNDYTATITMPKLTEIEASGGSDVRTYGTFTSDKLELSASGGSDLEMDVVVDRLELNASGGSDIEISGTANYLRADASGGSDLDASGLVAIEVDANASGGSDLDVHVTGSLTANASGGADIRYEGDPQKRDIDTGWGADVIRRR